MNEKRQQDRLKLDKLFNVYFSGEPCRIADVSGSGLGIVFMEGEDWPKNITLQYHLYWGILKSWQIKCRTVWESSMLFHTLDHERIIRRRGLVFIDEDPGSIDLLKSHLEEVEQVGTTGVNSSFQLFKKNV